MSDVYKDSVELHKKHTGKLEIKSKVSLSSKRDLSLAYTPGVAEPCREIYKNKNLVNTYTNKKNTVAVITDGSAVLGLGNIGPEAALPVMEGKAILFKEFANVDAIPICLKTQDTRKIIETIKNIAPSFGGINLEDISAPRCIEIERALINDLDIPVFHDDQHGTAIVTSAALINALKIVKKDFENINVLLIGLGAAGSAIARVLHLLGVKNIYAYNKQGIVGNDKYSTYDFSIRELLDYNIISVPDYEIKTLEDMFKNIDVCIGVSVGNIITKQMVENMNTDPIIFAMANPTPEIDPVDAKEWGVKILGTGRSDYPNQINNLLAFPGVFRGIIDSKYNIITNNMKINAAIAIANIIPDKELNEEYIIPSPFNKDVVKAVSEAIKKTSN